MKNITILLIYIILILTSGLTLAESNSDDITCDKTGKLCTTNWGVWVSSTGIDDYEYTIEYINIYKSELIIVRSYLLSNRSEMTRQTLINGQKLLKKRNNNFFCTTRNKNTNKKGYYFFKNTDTYTDVKNKCYGTEIFMKIDPIKLNFNCLSYSENKCYVQYIDPLDETIISDVVYFPDDTNISGDLYDGDLINISGTVNIISSEDDSIKLSSLDSIERSEQIAAIFITCDLGCRKTSPYKRYTSNPYRLLNSLLGRGEGPNQGDVFLHWNYFESPEFALKSIEKYAQCAAKDFKGC